MLTPKIIKHIMPSFLQNYAHTSKVLILSSINNSTRSKFQVLFYRLTQLRLPPNMSAIPIPVHFNDIDKPANDVCEAPRCSSQFGDTQVPRLARLSASLTSYFSSRLQHLNFDQTAVPDSGMPGPTTVP